MVRASTSTLSFSSITGSTPMRPNSSIMVVMSCRCGRLHTVTGSSASRVAARIGRAEFFAPEMRISPFRRTPPVMISLSIGYLVARRGSGALRPSGAAEEFHGHGVDAAVGDPGVEVGIDLLLALDRAEGRQFVTDQVELEVAALTLYLDLGIGQSCLEEMFHFLGLHIEPRSALGGHGGAGLRGAGHHTKKPPACEPREPGR